MPKLKFNRENKSIKQFIEVELENFSIITGLNGCGKTHLLNSILVGASSLDNIPINEIKYFDFTTFFIENERAFTDQQLTQEKIQAWKFLSENQNNLNLNGTLVNLKNQLGQNYNLILDIVSSSGKPFLKLVKDDFNTPELFIVYENYKKGFENLFNHNNAKNNPTYQGIKAHAYKLDDTLDNLTEREFKDFFMPITLKNEFLPTQLSKIFLDYKNKEYQELVIRKAEAAYYGEEVKIKDKSDFQEVYGPKPWVIIEEILNKFSSLDFTINNPEDLKFRNDSITSFSVQLKSLRTNSNIPFSDLSSGEKVLFALVLSIYKSFGDGKFPSVLLLDEIDATLHPSMINNLLDVIKDVFVTQNNVKVILATHSPTTIALTEEESIFIVNKENTIDKVVKQSKSIALNILTEGYISLSQGLNILDQITKKELNIFTEGNNTEFIKKAIEFYCPELTDKIEVMSNIADRTGKNQLPVLYDFFLRLEHSNNVLFVYDCDVKTTYEEKNKTFYYSLPSNQSNTKFINGIENIFPESLILDEHYKESTQCHKNGTITTTKLPDKNKICDYIIGNGSKSDFEGFKPMIEKIKTILL